MSLQLIEQLLRVLCEGREALTKPFLARDPSLLRVVLDHENSPASTDLAAGRFHLEWLLGQLDDLDQLALDDGPSSGERKTAVQKVASSLCNHVQGWDRAYNPVHRANTETRLEHTEHLLSVAQKNNRRIDEMKLDILKGRKLFDIELRALSNQGPHQ